MSRVSGTTLLLVSMVAIGCTPVDSMPVAVDDTDAASGMTDDSLSATDGGDAATSGSRSGTSGHGGSNGLDTGGSGRGGAVSGAGGSGSSKGGTGGSGGNAGINPSGMGMSMGNSSGAGGDGSASASSCPPTQLSCNGACVPNDMRNCGTCGHDCTVLPNVAGPVRCNGDVCTVSGTSCAKGWAHCSDDPELGCETDITQPTNCGKCAVACDASTPMCSEGVCVSGCPATSPTLCGGTCADTTKDTMHCGACETMCSTTIAHAQPTCTGSRCSFECTDGFMMCTGACADLNSDGQNCGSCGNVCSGGKMCMAGSCQCPASMHDCSGTCKADSPTSCGTSCDVCRSGVARASDTCDNGRCGFKCNSSLSVCSGQCLDTSSDSNNCGICGNRCTAPQTCAFGLCVCPSGQHKCPSGCVDNSSINSCGLFSCSPCAAPAGYSPTCDGLSCGMICDGGVNCGSTGACADTNKDPRNCGGCGITCLDPASIGPNCVFGSCTQ